MQISPVTAVHQALAALAAYDDPATFISLKPEAALLAEAAALEAAGPADKPLYGLIFAVKDNTDAAGLPTTAACPDFAYTPERSAFVVARLEADGAINRIVYAEVPPRVEYELTELGRSLAPVLRSLHRWGEDYQRVVVGASAGNRLVESDQP